MNEYVIFRYNIDAQDYVCSYPMRGLNRFQVLDALNILGGCPIPYDAEKGGHEIAWVSSESPNQARKAAYINWVRFDGEGFNKLPFRTYSV